MNSSQICANPGPAALKREVTRHFVVPICQLFAVLWCIAPAVLLASDPYDARTIIGQPHSSGNSDGTNAQASLNSPRGVAVDLAGNVFVADGNAIRRIRFAGSDVVLSTVAGVPGVSGSGDGSGSGAGFRVPEGITLGSSGNFFVADTGNDCIRMVTPAGVVTTLSGMANGEGSSDGTNAQARFRNPQGIAAGANGTLFVTDSANHTIRKLVPIGTNWVVSTIAGMAGVAGTNDGLGASARFNGPLGITVSGTNLFVCDFVNHTIRKLTPSGTNWMVSTFAGAPGDKGSSDGSTANARFNWPNGIAVDGGGNIFIADEGNHTLRKISAAGIVSTISGVPGIAEWNDGVGQEARYDQPAGLAMAPDGSMVLADYHNFVVRRVRSGVPLKINVLGSRVVLSWSSVANDGIPQARASLSPGYPWTNMPGPVVISGVRCYATNNYLPGSTFFRLVKP